MTVGIIDTTVIIHLFRKNPAALAWFESLPQRLSITPITWMEIIDGASGKAGQATCKTILNEFEMEYPTQTDMDWAMQQLERYRPSHGTGMNDCLIAAVAYQLQVPLYIHNLKHMQPLLDSLAIQPYS